MLDLNAIAGECYKINVARAQGGAMLEGNALKHCATEVVEACAARFWWKVGENKDKYAEELADIIICALDAAAQDEIDIEGALLAKVEKNRLRAQGEGDKK